MNQVDRDKTTQADEYGQLDSRTVDHGVTLEEYELERDIDERRR